MRVSGSINSIKIVNRLAVTNRALAKSLQRMSSGRRAPNASDDLAILASSSRFESSRRAISQLSLGLVQARGIANTASSSIQTQIDLVQRLRELALQASNGTLGISERENLNREFLSLREEFDRVARTASFNKRPLLDGSADRISVLLDEDLNTLDLTLPSLSSAEILPLLSETQTVVGTGSFAFNQNIATTSSFGLTSADLNGDGRLDLVSSDYADNTLSVLLGNGDGSFQSRVTLAAGNTPQEVITADVNNDGILDLVSGAEGENTLSIFIGNGDGSFQARTTVQAGTGPYSVAAVDLNGDGNLDLVSADSLQAGSLDTLSIFLGNGDGTFQSRTTLQTGNTPTGLSTGDLNGDGFADIVSVEYNSGTASVFLGNGDGSFEARATFATALGSADSVLNDFNNDGIIDLIVVNASNDSISLLQGNGDGSFSSTGNLSLNFSSFNQFLVVEDLNGDGNSDILSTDSSGDKVSVFFGNGDGSFQSEQTFSTGDGPGAFVASDFDGDGVFDLAVANYTDGNISIFTGETQTSTTSISADLLSVDGAQSLLSILDSALDQLLSERVKLNALVTRMDSSESVLALKDQAVAQARSFLEDADLAVEFAEFARIQSLQQIQMSVLAQNNVQMSMVLNLLEAN